MSSILFRLFVPLQLPVYRCTLFSVTLGVSRWCSTVYSFWAYFSENLSPVVNDHPATNLIFSFDSYHKKTVECCRFFSASVLPQGQQSRGALRDVAAGPTTAIWLHQFTSAPQPTRTTHLKSNCFSTLQKSPSWDLGLTRR